jgi:hypothetical protein
MDKDLSVDRAVAWLDTAFRKEEQLLDRTDVLSYLPLTRSTVYHWMRECGATYDEHVKSYYTDRHEADDVVGDRMCRYIPCTQSENLLDCCVLNKHYRTEQAEQAEQTDMQRSSPCRQSQPIGC